MTTSRCASAALLIGAAFPVSASAMSLEYYEYIEYRLEYFRPVGGGTVSIYQEGFNQGENWGAPRTARVYPGTGTVTFEEVSRISIGFSFVHAGISGFTAPLLNYVGGKTIDFGALMAGAPSTGFPHPLDYVWWEVPSPYRWWTPSGDWWENSQINGDWSRFDVPYDNDESFRGFGGSISFDETGISTQYATDFYWWDNYGDKDGGNLFLRSNPVSLAGHFASFVTNPDVLEGLWAFDSLYYQDYDDGDNYTFLLAPGQWRVTHAAKTCYVDDWMDTECRTATPAPVPLPASVWLLLSGLGALGARGFWNRRRIVA